MSRGGEALVGLAADQTQSYGLAYQYDAAGNRAQRTSSGVTASYSYNTLNQLADETTAGATTCYTWTADGGMATQHDATGWSYYPWDVDESLRRIQAPSDDDLASRYNARVPRTERVEVGALTYMLYDDGKLAAETDASLATARSYVSEGPGIYSPLVAQSGSEHWFLFDALGTTLGLTSDVGALTDAFLHEAFGTGLGRTGTTSTPYQYVGGYGYWNEPDVGLKQVWHRWYGAVTGSLISRDPLGPGRPESYAYVGQSPALNIDPTGLFEACWPVWPGRWSYFDRPLGPRQAIGNWELVSATMGQFSVPLPGLRPLPGAPVWTGRVRCMWSRKTEQPVERWKRRTVYLVCFNVEPCAPYPSVTGPYQREVPEEVLVGRLIVTGHDTRITGAPAPFVDDPFPTPNGPDLRALCEEFGRYGLD